MENDLRALLSQEKLKKTILQEVGLRQQLAGSARCREVRIAAANDLPKVIASHVWNFDPIACPSYANGLFRFAIDVARYGDIGEDELENTLEVVNQILNLLIDDLYHHKDNKYRKRRCNDLLLELVCRYTLFRAPTLTQAQQYCTIP